MSLSMNFFSRVNKNMDIVELRYPNILAKIHLRNDASSYFSNLLISVNVKLMKAIEDEKSLEKLSESINLILQNDEQEFWSIKEDVPADFKSPLLKLSWHKSVTIFMMLERIDFW